MPDDSQDSRDLISGGRLVAKALKAEGVEAVYTPCGGHTIDGCVDEGVDVADVRHEQVAAHAADGYARLTGKPGRAVVTAGPGTTDAVTGVADAYRAESPMLLIGGRGTHTQHKMGFLRDLPHVDMMSPITKSASTVPDTAGAAGMVSIAFRECHHGAPGIVGDNSSANQIRCGRKAKYGEARERVDPDAYTPGTMNQTTYK